MMVTLIGLQPSRTVIIHSLIASHVAVPMFVHAAVADLLRQIAIL
jgi:hypothetical protein